MSQLPNIPDISALMSSYNGAAFIAEAIDSVLAQDFQNFELVIVDDASTDETVSIIKRYTDPRIKLYCLEKNVGVGAALQYGLSKTSGRYLVKVDSDDICVATRFSKQKNFLEQHPDIAIVKSLIEYFPHDEATKASQRFFLMKEIKEKQLNSIVTPEQIRKTLNGWCCITHNSIMARSEAIKSVGYTNARMGEDYQLLYSLNKKGYRMSCVNEMLVHTRIRNTSITGSEGHQNEYANLLLTMKRDAISELLSAQKPHFIWGTGGLGKQFFSALRDDGFRVDGFIDRNPSLIGQALFDLPIYGPDYAKQHQLSISIAAQPVRESIVEYLNECGYKETDYFIFA